MGRIPMGLGKGVKRQPQDRGLLAGEAKGRPAAQQGLQDRSQYVVLQCLPVAGSDRGQLQVTRVH